MQKKFRTLTAITASGLALTAAAISASPGTNQAPVHAALAARIESVPSVTSAGIPSGQLNPGQEITSGTQIASPDGQFVLQMQSDGNLVLRAPGNIPIGDTHTAGHDGTIAVMQTDGNFVLRAPGNIPVWASGTDGHPGTVLQVQDDGNVVLYAPGHQVLRVLLPAALDPQNSVPTPTVSPATMPGPAIATIGASAAPTLASPAQPARPAAASSAHVASAVWVNTPYGASLSIMPNSTYGLGSAQAILNEALSIAGMPPYSLAVYNSLMEQLECHISAVVKKPYNLDTWRPSVSWVTEVADSCNPGYPHADVVQAIESQF